jgi:hypothetical protein
LDTNIFDPDYVQKQQVASLQAMAAQQNAVRVQAYTGQCANWVTVNLRNRDLGVPLAAVPVVPKKIVVSDAGEWTELPFADLQPPVLPAPVAVAPATGLRPAGPVPPDRLDQVIAILGVLNDKLDRLLASARSQS